jgi:HAD superfamily hydrolase (TIGR01509 family)
MSDPRIKAVIFDHGGVLTRGGEKGTNEKAASAAMGLDRVIEIPELNQALKVGAITNQQYVDEINLLYPNAPYKLTMAMWDNIYDTLVPDAAAYAYAEALRDRGLVVGMLSSINQAMAVRLHQDGSYDGFSPVVLSCYQGCAKPDPAIYAVVEFHLTGVDPAEILFLDDQEKCCEGARRRGWRAIRVDSSEQMIRDAGTLLNLDGVAG